MICENGSFSNSPSGALACFSFDKTIEHYDGSEHLLQFVYESLNRMWTPPNINGGGKFYKNKHHFAKCNSHIIEQKKINCFFSMDLTFKRVESGLLTGSEILNISRWHFVGAVISD